MNYDEATRANLVTSDALNRLATVGLLGGVGGAGLRAVQGLSAMFGRRKRKPDPATADIPLIVPPGYKTAQQAGGQDTWVGRQLGMYANTGDDPNLWAGSRAASPGGVPWFMPAALGAGLASGVGGYHLYDALINKKREGDLADDVDEAKQEFQQALTGEFAQAGKRASAPSRLTRALDELADVVVGREKTAQFSGGPLGDPTSVSLPSPNSDSIGSSLWDAAGKGVGLYGTGLLASLLAGGYLGYRGGQEKNRSSLVDKATQQMIADRMAVSPPEVYLPSRHPEEDD